MSALTPDTAEVNEVILLRTRDGFSRELSVTRGLYRVHLPVPLSMTELNTAPIDRFPGPPCYKTRVFEWRGECGERNMRIFEEMT